MALQGVAQIRQQRQVRGGLDDHRPELLCVLGLRAYRRLVGSSRSGRHGALYERAQELNLASRAALSARVLRDDRSHPQHGHLPHRRWVVLQSTTYCHALPCCAVVLLAPCVLCSFTARVRHTLPAFTARPPHPPPPQAANSALCSSTRRFTTSTRSARARS